jgi:hypothetical protein
MRQLRSAADRSPFYPFVDWRGWKKQKERGKKQKRGSVTGRVRDANVASRVITLARHRLPPIRFNPVTSSIPLARTRRGRTVCGREHFDIDVAFSSLLFFLISLFIPVFFFIGCSFVA